MRTSIANKVKIFGYPLNFRTSLTQKDLKLIVAAGAEFFKTVKKILKK